ncbi:AAA family ATPase [Hyalangium versicolor]|uniref:AAA family ATPase n=1 Tax=Hyalangium versicolor TaxID=2861190 RepID=UPI001CCFF6D3|nr:AAA family ATPase [Hyalangium versicolor]
MKLTKLKIDKYRGVAPGTELTFGPARTLVLGRNGTGRTTLLELISIILCSDFSGLVEEEFSLEYELAFPGMEIHVRAQNQRNSVTPKPEVPVAAALIPLRTPGAMTSLEPLIEATLRLGAPEARIVVRGDSTGLYCEVDGQSAYARSMHWSVLDRSVWTLIFMVAQYIDPAMKERLKELLHRTFLLAPSRFDETLGMFEHIGTIKYAMEMQGDEVFPLGLMALPTWMPAWLRAQVERQPPKSTLEVTHDAIAQSFLARFTSLAGFASGRFRVEVLEKRTYENGGRLGFGQFSFRFTRPDGTELTQAQLGYGQKRLLSFLYYLDVNEDFAIADELANGLHPRWVEACIRELGARQAFLTSQNPLLFEHIAFGSAEALRASLILCGTELRDGRERLIWSKPTSEAAAKLFEAHRTQTKPLGELLQAHGMW